MFYKIKAEDFIRVKPSDFEMDVEEAVKKNIISKFAGYISEELGVVIDVDEIIEIKDGVIIPGDASNYYKTIFSLITFSPEMHEVLNGSIKDIEDFGAFIDVGPLDGMVHISQVMDDFVSFSKEKVISGKKSNRTLKVGDECRGRITAISFKDITNPKLGLTMRQKYLGKHQWIIEDKQKKKEKAKDAKK